MRALFIFGSCLLFGCQFEIDGSGNTALPDAAPIAADLAVAADDLTATPDDLTALPADLAPPRADLAAPRDLMSPAELAVTVATASGNIDLTQLGSVDWAHFGLSSASSFDDKASGGQRVSTLTALPNSGALTQFAGASLQFSWSDGAVGTGHQAMASNSPTDVYVTSGGVQLHVPAGTTPQRLIVYAGIANARALLQVALSDGSQPAYTNTQTTSDAADHWFAYTIDFAAASAGQTLTVSWSLLMATTTTSSGAGIGGAALTTVPAKN